MKSETICVSFILNGKTIQVEAPPKKNLLELLRGMNVYSVKNGCGQGDCGLCTILVDGKPVRACMLTAADIQGHSLLTVEGLTPDGSVHPIQQAFVECGAVQCGFCTPAHILVTKALLDANPNPSEKEIRQALSNLRCRCTGFVRIVDAVRHAAELLRDETPHPSEPIHLTLPQNLEDLEIPQSYYRHDNLTWPLPPLVFSPTDMPPLSYVGKPQQKVDAVKLVQGKAVFTDDFKMDGMLFAALLTSPHAHARIRKIDTSKARSLPGVHAVLTYQDLPHIHYATGGQSYPQPLPYDQVSLDNKVRHVGDRVAVVAAETQDLAEQALKLIEVDYEVLPAVLDPLEAMQDGAPVIHDETDVEGIYDAQHNVVYHIEDSAGDVDMAFATADLVYENEYRTPRQHHAQSEMHTCISYWMKITAWYCVLLLRYPFMCDELLLL